MLVSIDAVLRCKPALRDLEAVIAKFLGPPPNMSLSDACHEGSIKLLDWIWNCSCTSVDDRATQWSLTNYLRSEPRYYSLQFSKSIATAANQGNLEMVKWLFAHFSDCGAPAGAAYNAAMWGHLHVLEFLWAHSDVNMPLYKKQKVIDGGSEIGGQYAAEYEETNNCVEWDNDYIIWAAAQCDRFDIVRWLYHNTPVNMREWPYDLTIEHILSTGDDELVQLLLPPGRCVLDYAKRCPRVDVIELMLDCGYLRRDAYLAVGAIRNLATSGRVDLMEQIVQLHSPLPKKYVGECWCSAIKEACLRGDLAMVQWLVEHRKGRQFCRVKMRKDSKHMHFLCYAAGAGSIDVMQFLYDKQYADQFVPALLSAVCKNQLAAVKWLIDHLPPEEQSTASCVIEAAASHGRLEILQYLAKLDAASSWWSPSETAMSLSSAAAGNFVDVAQWLVANHSNKGRSSIAMDKAAANGHLDMVKWLHTNGFKCSVAAMDAAAANGHLEMVRWLHENCTAGCTAHAMDLAAGRGHLDVLKWLHRNRSEGCTRKAMATPWSRATYES
ncbi:hypothetical protein PHYSODRAFT_533826 [Phytophthora sojae]|uniref:Uncharacterized protein n=1 Tax=Phytophthora sojae (strain P6497) TaxID=1094619 RepID=G5AG37_PHYSP|nr:hypothetical protein PHYSODRAFT_533826 [Phytophthora sojae]EGZ05549.1 hypothetical protein PHYSODRAFT_533826 [Phytophthora sojae]|eukprot:XP_009539080.1 hypothetical protein PHYSODRAFT_533826 [Phytophthora sojae]